MCTVIPIRRLRGQLMREYFDFTSIFSIECSHRNAEKDSWNPGLIPYLYQTPYQYQISTTIEALYIISEYIITEYCIS